MIDPKDNAAPNSDRLYSSYINDQPRHMFSLSQMGDILFFVEEIFILTWKSETDPCLLTKIIFVLPKYTDVRHTPVKRVE
jgi:hypothetical protein